MAADLADARGQAGDARDDARAIGEPVFEAAALACGALALTEAADVPGAGAAVDEAAAALERLSPAQLATRLPAFWMLARARRTFGLFAPALADLERGSAIAADTGRENILAQLTIETAATLVELGRLDEAVTAAEQGLDMARLAGNPRVLLWARCTLSTARLATGDVAGALLHATAAAESGTTPDFHSAGEPGWCLGRGLTAAGNPDRAVAAMLESFGGGSLGALLPADRPAAAADLATAQLAAGDVAAADRTLRLAEETAARAGRSWLAALPGVIRSEHLLGRGRADDALSAATAAREAATGAPLTAARGQLARVARSPRQAGGARPSRSSSPPSPGSTASGRCVSAIRRHGSCAGSGIVSAGPRRRPAQGSPSASMRSPAWSPPAARTARSRSSSFSAPGPSRRICATSTGSSGCAPASS